MTNAGHGESRPDPRLVAALREAGSHFRGGANRPIALDDPETVWFVESGALDVFLAEDRERGEQASNLKHMLRAGPGRLVFGVRGGREGALIAVGKSPAGSVLRSAPLESLLRADVDALLVEQVDQWIEELARAVVRGIPAARFPDAVLGAGEELELQGGEIVASRQGVVWAVPEGAAVSFLDTEDPDPEGPLRLPLTTSSWLAAYGPARVSAEDSMTLHEDSLLLPALDEYHGLLLSAEQTNRSLLLVDVANQEIARTGHLQVAEARARRSLYGVLSPAGVGTGGDGDSRLMAALAVIGRHEGIAFRPPAPDVAPETEPSLDDVVEVSGVRRRAVKLDAAVRWWVGDSGALLGFLKEDGRPVALLPRKGRRYRVVDPATGRSEAIDASSEGLLRRTAWFFYRPLPASGPVGALRMLRFSTHGMARDVFRFVAAGLAASLLMLAPAVAIGHLVDQVIPGGFVSALAGIILGLAGAAGIGALLQMQQGAGLMRIEGRAASRATAAIWDRLLRLPAGFLRRFAVGDLMIRVMVFQALRDRVSGVVANAALSLVFLAPALALVFLYDEVLGLICLAVGASTVAGAAALGLLQLGPQRRLYETTRGLAGDLLSFVNGMHKLRLNDAVAYATAFWARRYREQKKAELDIARWNSHFAAFGAAIPVLAGGAVIGVVVYRGAGSVSGGDFLAVFAALIIFCGVVLRFGQSFEALASIVPGYEQVAPILAASPETAETSATSCELYGRIDLDRVSFRYAEGLPLVLDEVSIRAEPGEFVAIVGESGAGKTTLLQLALGMETPSAGGVYFDGRDLAHLNRRAVRRQIGVVVQDGALLPGNIHDNIVGSFSDLTIEDAWKAAALAAVDRDIAAMPMNMYTVTGDNEATFSGGQAQRIRIAAALAKRPRVVLFDEATNWLDTESQAKVIAGLENLVATRIVIAHRLSTIRHADRIYVLQSGKVVQEGGFDELFAAPGLFRRLMLRQVVER